MKNKKLYQSFHKASQKQLISSAISITRGGLGVAVAKMTLAGKLGVEISLNGLPGKTSRNDFVLFSESQGRIIVSINPKNKARFESFMKKNSFACIGYVTQQKTFITSTTVGEKATSMGKVGISQTSVEGGGKNTNT